MIFLCLLSSYVWHISASYIYKGRIMTWWNKICFFPLFLRGKLESCPWISSAVNSAQRHSVQSLLCKPPSAGCWYQQEKPSSLSSVRDQSLGGFSCYPRGGCCCLAFTTMSSSPSSPLYQIRLQLKGDPQPCSGLPFQTSVWSSEIITLWLIQCR